MGPEGLARDFFDVRQPLRCESGPFESATIELILVRSCFQPFLGANKHTCT